MADNTIINPGSGGDAIATDDIGGVKFQRVKVTHGADGSATDVSSASPLPVDTELPAAAALSDSTANPTAPMVGAAGMVYDAAATGWKRQVQAKPTWDLHTYNGVAAGVQLLAQDDTYLRPQKIAASVADGDTGTYHGVTSPRLYNGSSFDRQRGNTEGTLLASAARTASPAAPTLTTYNARSLMVYLNIEVPSGNSETIAIYPGWVDPVSTNPTYAANPFVYTGTGASNVYSFAIGLGILSSADIVSATPGRFSQVYNLPLARTMRFLVAHSGSTSTTYSIGYSLGV